MQQESERYLTSGDAARLADVSVETIRLWERNGRLPAIRTVSGTRLFRAEDVIEAKRRRTGALQEPVHG